MEFHVIELPKLPKELKEGDTLLLWAKFINAERKEEFDMLATKNAYIQSAYDQLQMISQDRNDWNMKQEKKRFWIIIS